MGDPLDRGVRRRCGGCAGPPLRVHPGSELDQYEWFGDVRSRLGTTTVYTTAFELPMTSSASIKLEVLADNAAVDIKLNGSSIGFQTDGDIFANYQTVSTYAPDTAVFRTGTNTLTNWSRDYGVVDGIAFKASITYTPVPIVVSFVTPDVKTADGSTTAAITSCSVAASGDRPRVCSCGRRHGGLRHRGLRLGQGRDGRPGGLRARHRYRSLTNTPSGASPARPLASGPLASKSSTQRLASEGQWRSALSRSIRRRTRPSTASACRRRAGLSRAGRPRARRSARPGLRPSR